MQDRIYLIYKLYVVFCEPFVKAVLIFLKGCRVLRCFYVMLTDFPKAEVEPIAVECIEVAVELYGHCDYTLVLFDHHIDASFR